jgi:hypothetical protein
LVNRSTRLVSPYFYDKACQPSAAEIALLQRLHVMCQHAECFTGYIAASHSP